MSLRAIARAVGAEEAEAPRVRWAFTLLFCVFASWYVVRPVRDAMGTAGDAAGLPRLFLISLGATLVLTPLVSRVASTTPRRVFFGIVFRFVAATLFFFAFVLRGGAPNVLYARAFFVWASAFNLFQVALSWGLLADVFSRTEGVRLFAVAGAGGTLGAMFGSLVATSFVSRAGAAPLLVLGALLLEGAVRCVGHLDRAATPAGPLVVDERAADAVRWVRRAARSGYLLSICAYVLLFTLTSTVLYLEQGRIVQGVGGGVGARTSIFARMDLAVNALTLLLQVTVVGRAVRRMGVGGALAILPLATLGCYVAIRVSPILPVLVVCQVARRVLDFAFTRPAREVLFTTVSRDEKYKAKSFIDTFVYRGGDAIGAVGFTVGRGAGSFAAVAVVCAAWAAIGIRLGRHQKAAPPS